VYTAVYTGMRWSELVGLRRLGVDLLRRTIALTEQLVYIGGDSRAGGSGRWVRQKPKTRAGVRSISVSGFLAEHLEEQLANRPSPAGTGSYLSTCAAGPSGDRSSTSDTGSPPAPPLGSTI
jgi:integrase